MNELQVRERADLTTDELIAEWDTTSAEALRRPQQLPRPVARLPLLALPAPVGRQPLAYLFDVGFTRDVWMHRIDLAGATGRPLDLDAEHDGRILADLVAEWAATHGEPFDLELDGPGRRPYRAGRWRAGARRRRRVRPRSWPSAPTATACCATSCRSEPHVAPRRLRAPVRGSLSNHARTRIRRNGPDQRPFGDRWSRPVAWRGIGGLMGPRVAVIVVALRPAPEPPPNSQRSRPEHVHHRSCSRPPRSRLVA